MRALPLLLLLALLLSGCTAAEVPEDEVAGRGNATPEGVVESFIGSLNSALADPNLAVPATRRIWAERLASYFTPSERVDQRGAMNQMLAAFADSAARPTYGSRVELEITYSAVKTMSRNGNEALVGLTDGVVNLRWLNDNDELVRERTSDLFQLLGQESDGLPVLRVGPSWFMTEG